MQFIVSFQTVDSTEESEREFTSLVDAQAFVCSMDDLLVFHSISDEVGEIDSTHYCGKHNSHTGEGDICAKCEEAADHARNLLNVEMSKHAYQLWFVCSKQVQFRCPVATFDEAKLLFHCLIGSVTTGVRIARMDPTEGCESVLHKFN